MNDGFQIPQHDMKNNSIPFLSFFLRNKNDFMKRKLLTADEHPQKLQYTFHLHK